MLVNTPTGAALEAHAEPAAASAAGLKLEDIWDAISKDQFLPHYQPKVVLKGMDLVGVEALMRWNHPEHGLLSAGTFLHLVADNFLFDDLTAIMLEKAIGQCHRWYNQGLDIEVSVNLSPDLLLTPGLTDRIEAKTIEHSVAHDKIIIEVPESAIAHEARDVLDTLERLTRIGARLAIDDYGTGYSSLAHLRNLHARQIKLDKTFMADVPGDAGNMAITDAIIAMARTLHLTVIAEGVETRPQFELLRRLGCDEVQGYYFSAPVPFGEATTLLAEASSTKVAEA